MTESAIVNTSPPSNPVASFSEFLMNCSDELDRVAIEKPVFELDLSKLLESDAQLCYYLTQNQRALEELENAIRGKVASLGLEDIRIKILPNDLIEKEIPRVYQMNTELVQIEGDIAAMTPFITFLDNAVFECPTCGNLMEVDVAIEQDAKINECSNPSCNNKKNFRLVKEESTTFQARFVWVYHKEKYIQLFQRQEVGDFRVGDHCKIIGRVGYRKINEKRGYYQKYIDVNNYKILSHTTNQDILDLQNRIIMTQDGIYLQTGDVDKFNSERLYSWKKLQINFRYRIEEGPIEVWRYSGYADMGEAKVYFYNISFNDLKQFIQTNCAVSGKNMNLCTIPLQNYVSETEDCTEKITYMLGFTKEGWKLPFNSVFIIEDEIGKQVFKNLRNVWKGKINIENEKEKFRNFYNLTGIKYRDLLFQWSIVSPYLYVIRDLLSLMPGLALQGPPETGKTNFMEVVVKKWFGHLEVALSADDSTSQMESYFASSTFLILIDEATNDSKWVLNKVKTYLTTEAAFLRKGQGRGKQFASVNKPKCAPIAITCNDPPEWFSDDAFLQRFFIGDIDECEKIAGWTEAKRSFLVGSVGRILYEETKDWTRDTIKDILDSIVVPPEFRNGGDRVQTIYKVFKLGMKLLKKVFGIETSLSGLREILAAGRALNNETLSELMIYQTEVGIPKEIELPRTKEGVIDYGHAPERTHTFYPTNWVKTPICESNVEIDGKLTGCFAWTVNNIRDLQVQFEGNNTKKWSLQTFFMKIKNFFPNAKNGLRRVSFFDGECFIDKYARVVTIPCEDLELSES